MLLVLKKCVALFAMLNLQQEDLEATAREELLREELLEEIEQRVGGLRELEEAGREEELADAK